MTISEQAVKAMPERIYAVKHTEGSNCVVSFDTPSLDYNVEYVRADLIPFLSVQGAVKASERLSEAEKEITRYQQERERWINYTMDLQRIIEALCDRRGLPEPLSTARHHYDMAREYLSSRAGNATRILSALEPSAARELALEEALRKMVALYESEYDADVPFKRPDWLVAALHPASTGTDEAQTVKAEESSFHAGATSFPTVEQNVAREDGDLQELLERLDAGLEYEGWAETDGAPVELFDVEAAQDLFADAAAAIRALSSPDHADAGKLDAVAICKKLAPYLGATAANDWTGLKDDDAISMTVKMRVGDLRTLKAVATDEADAGKVEGHGWLPIESAPDHEQGPFLVTNNPKAVNAFGRPSHVWCVDSIHVDDDGSFCAFHGYQKIHDLKMFAIVSAPASEGAE